MSDPPDLVTDVATFAPLAAIRRVVHNFHSLTYIERNAHHEYPLLFSLSVFQ